MILPRASLENRHQKYTSYEDARNHRLNVVCGAFMTLEEALAGKRVEIPFKFQVTEFPELQFLDDYCTAVFGNLDLEFELTNVGNIVWCMVDPLAVFDAEEWDLV